MQFLCLPFGESELNCSSKSINLSAPCFQTITGQMLRINTWKTAINCSVCVCQEVADNQIDTGDLMDCLVQNKHQKEMNDKCAVGVTHFQLVRRSEQC